MKKPQPPQKTVSINLYAQRLANYEAAMKRWNFERNCNKIHKGK